MKQLFFNEAKRLLQGCIDEKYQFTAQRDSRYVIIHKSQLNVNGIMGRVPNCSIALDHMKIKGEEEFILRVNNYEDTVVNVKITKEEYEELVPYVNKCIQVCEDHLLEFVKNL